MAEASLFGESTEMFFLLQVDCGEHGDVHGCDEECVQRPHEDPQEVRPQGIHH